MSKQCPEVRRLKISRNFKLNLLSTVCNLDKDKWHCNIKVEKQRKGDEQVLIYLRNSNEEANPKKKITFALILCR